MRGDAEWLASCAAFIFVLQHQTSGCSRAAWQRGPGKGKYFVLPATQVEFWSLDRGSAYCGRGLFLCTSHSEPCRLQVKASSHALFTLPDLNLPSSFQTLLLSSRNKNETSHVQAFKLAVHPSLLHVWSSEHVGEGIEVRPHSVTSPRQTNPVEVWGSEPHSSLSETVASLLNRHCCDGASFLGCCSSLGNHPLPWEVILVSFCLPYWSQPWNWQLLLVGSGSRCEEEWVQQCRLGRCCRGQALKRSCGIHAVHSPGLAQDSLQL